MAEHSGTAGSVVLIINGTAAVDSLAQWTANFSREQVTFQKFGNTWVQRRIGSGDATGTFTGQWNQADLTGQVKLRNAYLGGSLVTLKLYNDGTAYWNGTAYLTAMGQTTAQSAMVTSEFTWGGDGSAWTYTG